MATLPLWPATVRGGRLVKQLNRYVQNLVDESAHGNRTLFLDDVFVAYLLAFFNPTLRTLRAIEDFSGTRQAQKHLSVTRICRSTLSDFHHLAEPERLRPIIEALRVELLRKTARGVVPNDLDGVLQQVLAVDGTFLPAAAGVAWAICERNQRQAKAYRARLDVHVDVRTFLPEVIVVPQVTESEADSAARTVTPGALHIYDRAYGSFDLMAAHLRRDGDRWEAHADFVIRLKKPGGNTPTFVAEQDHPLTAEACAANVVADRTGKLPGLQRQEIDVTVREVVLTAPDGSMVRLITNRLDLPAATIAQIYQWRWQIELFFRWLKCYANFDHLISHGREGVLLHFYVVIVGTLLMYLHTGYRPSKYTFVLLGLVARGGSTLDEILPILRERERQCEVARQSAARRRVRKKTEPQ